MADKLLNMNLDMPKMISSPARILLVEDEPAHAELIRRALELQPGEFQLSIASTFSQAKSFLAREQSPDLVITDWRLPDGYGTELLQDILDKTALPVLILTSQGNERIAVEALRAGAADYVVKSEITFQDMPHIVRRALQAWNNLIERRRAEQALKESEERYRSLFENATTGIYRTTPDGTILDANSHLLKMLGYDSLDDLSQRNLEKGGFNTLSPRKSFKQGFEQRGFVNGMESAWIRKDGTTLYVRESAKIFCDESGRTYYEGTVEDITERVLAEREAKLQTSNMRMVSELALQMAEVFSEKDLYRWVTEKTKELTGAVAASIAIYDPLDEFLVVRHIAIKSSLLGRVQGMLSQWLSEMRIKIDATQKNRLMEQEAERITSLGELTFGAIPDDVGNLILKTLGAGEICACALKLEKQLLGTLVVYMPVGTVPVSLEMLKALSHVVAVSLRRWRVEGDLHRINRALRMTSTCNQTLIRATEEISLLKAICRIIVETGGYRFAWIGFPKKEDWDEIYPVAQSGQETGFLRLGVQKQLSILTLPPAILDSIRRLQPVDVKNIKTDARAAAWQAEAISRGYYAGIVFPLATNNQLLGSLCIFAGRDHHIDQDEMMLLGEMAEDLAFGIFTLRVGEEKRRAEKLLEKSNLELEASYDATLAGWSRALELRERETAGHSARVVNLVERLAKRMGLSGQQVIHLRRGALLHDIGKMGIPDSILLKQGPLNPGEWDIMQKHTLYASRLLTDIPYLMPALEIPLYHHERWDGSGYPYGLRDEQIPLAARIFAIVDVWDALTNDRPYHQAMLNREALAYLQANAGKLFDPKVCEAFLEMLDDQRK